MYIKNFAASTRPLNIIIHGLYRSTGSTWRISLLSALAYFLFDTAWHMQLPYLTWHTYAHTAYTVCALYLLCMHSFLTFFFLTYTLLKSALSISTSDLPSWSCGNPLRGVASFSATRYVQVKEYKAHSHYVYHDSLVTHYLANYICICTHA